MRDAVQLRPNIEQIKYRDLVIEYLASRGLMEGRGYGQPYNNNFEGVRLSHLKKGESRFCDIMVLEGAISFANYTGNDAFIERDRVIDDFCEFLIGKGINMQ